MLPLKVAKKKKIQSTSTVKQSTTSCGKQKKSATLGTYFMPRTTPGAQKSLQNCWQRKEAVERCDLALAKWMIDACVPFNAVNSVYYQHAIDAVTAMGPGYKRPNLHAIRGYYLAKAVDEVKIYVETYREIWKKTGCTLMADGWTDQKRRTLINFLVYCPKGTIFLKTVDVSDVSKTARLLYQLFREVVLYVGVENIVHMVTDNAANYVAAGKLLMEEFPSIFWSPCVAHCINLILQDIGKLQSVCCVIKHASGITKYIYNHCYPLYLMKKFTGGKEILRPAPTRFATNFIALQSILAHKDELRAMVTSREWVSSAYAKDSKGKKFVESVLDSLFWEECAIIVRMSEPLIRVLRMVDGDDRPSMGYLYDAIHHAKEEMMRRFQKRKARVKPFIDIINVLEKYAHENLPLQSEITSEMKLFRNAEHDFGRVSVHRDVVGDDEALCRASLMKCCIGKGIGCERQRRITSSVSYLSETLQGEEEEGEEEKEEGEEEQEATQAREEMLEENENGGADGLLKLLLLLLWRKREKQSVEREKCGGEDGDQADGDSGGGQREELVFMGVYRLGLLVFSSEKAAVEEVERAAEG
ncbi:uncharacterized protein LOC18107321 [Populus trichocarpa]|uniref:uncharacterized protein LOC18107321 n=1 Tax=Populus trichocarpa TaxID=3694 RepID=UPI0022793AE9|nr:uncharacterized protein LOC18107321 [Populus trichocarpa]